MTDPLHTAPPDAARRWVEEAVGQGSRVLGFRRLTGGITSAVHAIAVEDAGGRRHRLVLRRWVGDLRHEGPANVMRESEVLSRLEGAGLAAPRLVAADVDGEGCGDPALLMTRLRGRIELSPHDPTDWLGQMAEVLVRIHESDVVLADFERFIDPSTLEVPGWAARPSLWAEAIEILADEPSGGRRCLIHHDFQQFNLLWLRGKLAGVVDWVWAGHGPPDVDVAHCRLNLTVLYSHSRAEEFRLLYEARADRRIDPWWDLAGLLAYLPGWGPFLQQQAGPRMRVDFGGMHARVEEALAAILARS